MAVVRLKKAGKRFEVACYKNKVVNWRTGTESDLSEVLQSEEVFQNVVKGQVAKAQDLRKAFGTDDHLEVCKIILRKGELQVSPEERQHELRNHLHDIVNVLVEKTVNPESQLPYTPSMLERALQNIHFQVDLKRSAKQQALDAIARLREHLPIERAKMRLRMTVPAASREAMLRELGERGATVESQKQGGEREGKHEAVFLAPPHQYRGLDALAAKELGGTLEVLTLTVHRALPAGGVEPLARQLEQAALLAAKPAARAPAAAALPPERRKKLACNTCKVEFADTTAHREHFRSEVHRVNLKRKAEGLPPLTEEELAVTL